jgi:hypothetical protein
MNQLESKVIVPEEISVVDWYDGLVIGVGQQNAFLIVLVAWDMEHSRKAYLLLDIEPAVETSIKRSIQNKAWNEFQETHNFLVTHYTGDIFLVLEEPEVGKSVSARRVAARDLTALRDHDVENTLTPEYLKLWFGM